MHSDGGFKTLNICRSLYVCSNSYIYINPSRFEIGLFSSLSDSNRESSEIWITVFASYYFGQSLENPYFADNASSAASPMQRIGVLASGRRSVLLKTQITHSKLMTHRFRLLLTMHFMPYLCMRTRS